MLRKLTVLVLLLTGVTLPWQGGVFIWLGLFSLVAGLLVLARPDSAVLGDAAAQAEKENLIHGNPARDTTRSDYFLHGPGNGGPGDGGTV